MKEDSSFDILNNLAFIGVLVVENKRIIFANQEIENILGRRPEDLAGKALSIIFSRLAYNFFLEILSRVKSGEVEKVQVDSICLCKKKENVYCFFSLYAHDSGQVIITIQDAASGGLVSDHLTGLYNRRAFFTLANHEIETAKRYKRQLFVICLDMDGLKEVNDTFGHAAGDELLKSMAEILRATFRKSDIIARLGGDEFSVLALGETGTIKMLMDRLKGIAKLGSRESLAKNGFPISFSSGVSMVRYDLEDQFQLALKEADKLMYEEKRVKNKHYHGSDNA